MRLGLKAYNILQFFGSILSAQRQVPGPFAAAFAFTFGGAGIAVARAGASYGQAWPRCPVAGRSLGCHARLLCHEAGGRWVRNEGRKMFNRVFRNDVNKL